MSLIGFDIHEGIELGGVRELYFNDPVCESVLIEQFGLILEGFVDLDDGAADGGDEVAGGFDTFYGAKLFACGDFVVHFGHINVNDVTQCVLSIVADTNVTKFAFYANVLV